MIKIKKKQHTNRLSELSVDPKNLTKIKMRYLNQAFVHLTEIFEYDPMRDEKRNIA